MTRSPRKRRRRPSACEPRISRGRVARSSPKRPWCSKGTDVPEQTYLHWPFFTAAHRDLQRDVQAWRDGGLRMEDEADVHASCRSYVAQLGAAGWLKYAVPFERGGAIDALDLRSICVIRETLAYTSSLAEFAFAMQGLGSGPILLFGSEALKKRYLP